MQRNTNKYSFQALLHGKDKMNAMCQSSCIIELINMYVAQVFQIAVVLVTCDIVLHGRFDGFGGYRNIHSSSCGATIAVLGLVTSE